MKRGDLINFEQSEGALIANHGHIVGLDSNFVAIEIDMKSKRGEVAGSMGGYEKTAPAILLIPTKDSLHLRIGKEKEMTIISFIDFIGFHVWCGEMSRYTLRLCLKKDLQL